MLLRLSPAALAALALYSGPAPAAPGQAEPVVVTASRFVDSATATPANVSTISREEIAASPAVSIPDLLKARAGIDLRPLYGPLGIDAAVDVRGFGDAGTSNTLVLIDGVRLNPVDSGSINWSALPLEAIERIEIIRGSGAVLYGDQAVGGVINIVTDKSARKHSTAELALGSYDYRKASVASQGGSGSFVYQAAASYAETAGWRDNNDADQRAASGRLGWFLGDDSELFADLAVFGDSTGQPASIAESDYRHRPRFARTPDDRAKTEGYRVRPGLTRQFGDTLELAIESGFEHQRAVFTSPSFLSVRDRDTLFATPRLRWKHGLAGLPSETVAGIDWYHGKVEAATDSSFGGPNLQTGRQISRALYLQNTTRLPAGLSLTLGFRRQLADQRATDRQAALSGQATRAQNAHDLGLAWQPSERVRLFARGGRVFRFANTDELFGFDPNTFESTFAGDLKPQHGFTRELGGDLRLGPVALRAALYRLDLSDEIGFNSQIFANENFADTRRQGLEVEAEWASAAGLYARLSYARQSAKFREGPWEGNTIPLVPGHQAALAAGWKGGPLGDWSVVLREVGKRRYSGDFDNALKKLDGYVTADLRADWQFSAWTVGLRVANLFDRRYAPFALYSSFQGDFFYFPADPQSVFVHARYAFR